jgi:hypothetical protein
MPAAQLFKNNAKTTLNGTLAIGGTSINLPSGHGNRFPTPSGSDYFLITLYEKDGASSEINYEVVKCTARVGDVLTVVRDFEGLVVANGGTSGGWAYPAAIGVNPSQIVYIDLRYTAYAAGNAFGKDGNLAGIASASEGRTNLGLGTLATQNANNVTITGGTLTGVTLEDSTTIFADNIDNTKKMQFQLSSIGAGLTRTVTFPNTDITLPGVNIANTWAAAQTFGSTLNKITFTAPANAATLTLADNKTFTLNNTITLSGTDGSTLNVGAGGTLGSAAYTASGAYEPATSAFTGKTYNGLFVSVATNTGTLTAGTSALVWNTSGTIGSAAFTASSAYATSAQGTLATNALPASSFSDAGVTGKLITGYVSGAGTVAATDTILQAINKLNGNMANYSPVAGSGSITTVGTIATGTWNATAIADNKIATALTGKTYNGLTPTALATGWSLAGGTTSKTLTLSNTLTLAGTDGSTLNVGAGGTLGSAAFTASSAYQAAGSYAASSHTHGNITNAGAIGSTTNLPIITTTSGVLTTGTFGSAANTFCQGNDSRLSDARTPTSHTHGNITNAGAIGATANLPVITTTSGVLTTGTFGSTANTFCQGDDSRLSNTRNTTNSITFNNGGAGGATGSTFNGSGALTVSYNTVGAPGATGNGASGSWGISITGSSASCTGNAATSSNTSSISSAIGTSYAWTKPQRPSLQAETAPSANVLTWDLTDDAVYQCNLNANITTFNLTGTLASLIGYQYQFVVRYNGGTAITWNANIKWPGGTAPTLTGTSGKLDIFTFVVGSSDGGTTCFLYNTGRTQNL